MVLRTVFTELVLTRDLTLGYQIPVVFASVVVIVDELNSFFVFLAQGAILLEYSDSYKVPNVNELHIFNDSGVFEQFSLGCTCFSEPI
jgi:hypothetical protein